MSKAQTPEAPGASSFAATLAEARKAKGLTQQQLADEIGVSQGAVGNWESGRTHKGKPSYPSLGTLKDIATVLDVNVADLVDLMVTNAAVEVSA